MANPDSYPRQAARTQGFTLGQPKGLMLFDGFGLFLRSDGAEDPTHHLWRCDLSGNSTKVVDARDVADLFDATDGLSPHELARRERSRERAGGIVSFATSADGRVITFALRGELIVVEIDHTGQVSVEALAVEGDRTEVFDPRPNAHGTAIALVCDREFVVVDRHGSVICAVEEDDPAVTWGTADFIAAEEMHRMRGFWWSPDGDALAVCRNDVAAVQRWFIGDPSNPAAAPAPHRYPVAGSTNPDVDLYIVPLDGDRRRVEWDHQAAEYLAAVHWNRHACAITVQSRDQRTVNYLRVDTDTGATTDWFVDHDERWVELVPGSGQPIGNDRLAIAADRDGARRLLIASAPEVAEMLTPVDLQVRSIVAASAEEIVISANPIDDSTVVHIHRWSSGHVDALTSATGVHRAVVGAAGTALCSSTMNQPGAVWTLPGGAELESVAAIPTLVPNVRFLRSGPAECATAVVLPHDHDGTPIPVLLDPYGGPHASRVLHSHNSWLTSQWFAEQGFAVVVTDGRGTPGRGTDFERAIYRDLATGVLEDQVGGLESAIALLRSTDPNLVVDRSRVAIRGWSFGGYLAALAVLDRPDVFAAAVAGAPVTTWNLYDTHYTERYLGDPHEEPDAYDRSSLIVRAPELRRPLLLIHGLADDNVVAAHTLQLSQALLAAGRPHEVLPLVNMTHMAADPGVAENLLLHQLNFLRRSLGLDTPQSDAIDYGVEPMNDRLNEMYQGVAVPATANSEHVAALELMVLVMAADSSIDEIEIDEIKQITADWRDDDFSLDNYLEAAIAKATAAIEAQEATAMIADIDSRISSRVLRRALFSAVRDVAGVDHDVTPDEGTILAEVAVRFA